MSESITQECDSIDTFNDSDISGDPSYNPEEEECSTFGGIGCNHNVVEYIYDTIQLTTNIQID